MTITLDDLQSYIKHVLSGGGRLDTSLPGSDADAVEKGVINQAGRWFFSCHQWNFREAPPVSIDFPGSQDQIDLPVDFGEMVTYQMTSGLTYGIQFTTPAKVAEMRATTVTVATYQHWATIVQPSQQSPTEGMPPPHLEVWPVPTAQEDALTIWYRRKWAELDATTDAANVPDYAEFALAMTCRAFASGLSEEYGNERDIESELNKLVGGHVFDALRTADGLLQSDYGPMTNGAIQLLYPQASWVNRSASPVSGPA